MSDGASDLLNARVDLLEALRQRNYRFVTPTPATHKRVVARGDVAMDLRGALGWSLPFDENKIDTEICRLLRAADAIEDHGSLLKSRYRVSSLGEDLFLHSAFPTTQQDAVFFGPDSYRFAAFVRSELPAHGARERIVDIGAGTGVGAVAVARALDGLMGPAAYGRIINSIDINAAALDLAKANVLATGVPGGYGFLVSDGLTGLNEEPDCIITNPPYIADSEHRAYRDGGGMRGAGLSLRWAREAAEALAPSGVFLLYTGSAIVGGEDRLEQELREILAGFDVRYRELDPDVFGEELEREDYADVERIAVVGVVAVKR